MKGTIYGKSYWDLKSEFTWNEGKKRTDQMIGMKRIYRAKYHHTKQRGNVKFYTRKRQSISHELSG